MRLFLCGGGSKEQTIEANKKLNEIIDHNKPLLYVPLAMQQEQYNRCYEWIHEELKDVEVPRIDMVMCATELLDKELQEYSAIFIGGGNTYKLLSELKASGAFMKIQEYLNNDGIIFGGSAGAIILGECIDTCKCIDTNTVGLKDFMGFNAFNNFSILCHFTNEDEEQTEINRKYLLELSNEEKIIALPEEDTIYYEDGKYEVIGSKPYYIFEQGNMLVFNSSIDRKIEFLKVTTEQQLMDFMNHNITYGWVDGKGEKHLNNLKGFRKNYRTSSMEEILQTGLGTCIEQAKLIKFFFDKIGLQNKLYCYRSYETEDHFDKEIRMHCFVVYKQGDIWYHFEHANQVKRGIYKYFSLDEAIQVEIDRHDESDIRELTEIPEIPDGFSFKEFNEYVNQFDKEQKYSKVKL